MLNTSTLYIFFLFFHSFLKLFISKHVSDIGKESISDIGEDLISNICK